MHLTVIYQFVYENVKAGNAEHFAKVILNIHFSPHPSSMSSNCKRLSRRLSIPAPSEMCANCCLITFLFFICVKMASRRICSSGLQQIEVRLIGVFLISSFLPVSKMRATWFLSDLKNPSWSPFRDDQAWPCSDISQLPPCSWVHLSCPINLQMFILFKSFLLWSSSTVVGSYRLQLVSKMFWIHEQVKG